MSLFGNYRNRRMPVDEPEVIQIDSDKEEEEEVRYLKTNASNKRKVQSHLQQMAIKMPGSNEHALLFLKEKGPLEAHHHEHTHNTYGGNGNIIVAGANAKITGGIGNKTVSTATTTGGFFKSKKVKGNLANKLKHAVESADAITTDLHAIVAGTFSVLRKKHVLELRMVGFTQPV